MGNNSSYFPCYEHDLPSSRVTFENQLFNSLGPVKIPQKKCTIATSETISIAPVRLNSNRSSVTEFAVNRSEITTEAISRTPEKPKVFSYSALSSPGRSVTSDAAEVFSRNSRKEGVNLVAKIRSKSLAGTPKQSIGTELSGRAEKLTRLQCHYNEASKKKNKMVFEPLILARDLSQRGKYFKNC